VEFGGFKGGLHIMVFWIFVGNPWLGDENFSALVSFQRDPFFYCTTRAAIFFVQLFYLEDSTNGFWEY
jgi:hypothetical protein